MQPSPAPLELIRQVSTLPPRSPESNKGDFGRILVVAGSRGMSGAAVLCASAALRGGAGLVRVAVPEGILPIVAAGSPCYMTAPLPQDAQGCLAESAATELLSLAQANDVVALGPGLGRSPAVSALVSGLLAKVPTPLVLDADGLNALQDHPERFQERRNFRSGDSGLAPVILTPHPGEFARLLGSDVATVQDRRQELAIRFAREHEVILVLKGHATIVTDGRQVYQNGTGNPGMATGGTGDVLTGLIAALLGQRLKPFAAAQLGVYLHGLAGDLARDAVGEAPLIATDVLQYLPAAFRERRG